MDMEPVHCIACLPHSFASTKLYCLETEAMEYEKLAYGFYAAVLWLGVRLAEMQASSPTTLCFATTVMYCRHHTHLHEHSYLQ